MKRNLYVLIILFNLKTFAAAPKAETFTPIPDDILNTLSGIDFEDASSVTYESVLAPILTFIKKDPKNINAKNKKGMTLAMIAATNANSSVRRLIIYGTNPKPNWDIKDSAGWTILHHIAHNGDSWDMAAIVNRKIPNSLDLNELSYDGQSPLDLAIAAQINKRKKKDDRSERKYALINAGALTGPEVKAKQKLMAKK